MTPESFHGDPVPLPTTERFSAGSSRDRAVGALRALVDQTRDKARQLGAEAEVFGATREASTAAPAGMHSENFAINQKVEALMRDGLDFDAALAQVVGGDAPARGVDGEREAMNRKVEAHMASTGCDISEAIRHVESAAV